MVEIITSQIRSQAQRAIRDVGRQQSTLSKREKQFSTSAILRGLGREELIRRKESLQEISRFRKILQTRSGELKRISGLPTRAEFIGGLTKRIKTARKLVSQNVPLGLISGDIRSIVRNLREGLSGRDIRREQLKDIAEFTKEFGIQSLPSGKIKLISGEIFDPKKITIKGSTFTEQEVLQTLAPEIRRLPVSEVKARQTLLRPSDVTLPEIATGIARASGVTELIGTTARERKARQTLIPTTKLQTLEKKTRVQIANALRKAPGVLTSLGARIGFTGAGLPPGLETLTIGDIRTASEKDFQGKSDEIQKQLNAGKITEAQANAQLLKEQKKFETLQALTRVPEQVALGAGLALLGAAVPIIGAGLTLGFSIDLILRREELAKQFKRFPKASIIDTASFLVGGLAGVGIGRGIKANPRNLKSITKVAGKDKTKLINLAKQGFEPNFELLQKQGKITGTTSYDLELINGTRIKVLEFSKLTDKDLAQGLKGTREFIGFELKPELTFLKGGRLKPGDSIFGAGLETLVNGQSKSFTRIFRFPPVDRVKARLLQKFKISKKLRGGEVVDVIEESRVVGIKAIGITKLGVKKVATKTVAIIESEARILKRSKLKGDLLEKAQQLDNKIKRTGKLPSTSEIRTLINLERRSNLKEPFTKAEFDKAFGGIKSNIVIVNILKRAKLFKKITPFFEKKVATGFGQFAGQVFSKPIEPIIKSTVKRPVAKISSPFIKNLKKNIKTLEKQRKAERTKEIKASISRRIQTLKQSLKKQVTIKKEIIVPTSGIIAALTVPPAPPSGVFATVGKFRTAPILSIDRARGTQVTLTSTSAIVKPAVTQAILQSQSLLQRLQLKQKTLQKQIVGQTNLNIQRQLIKQRQLLAQSIILKQKQLLKQKQVLKQKTAIKSIVSPKKPRLFPPPRLRTEDFGAKVNPFGKPIGKQPGYKAFFKKGKSFRPISLVPVLKKIAQDQGAFIIDRSLARTFRIRKVKGQAQKPIVTVPTGYFQRTRQKYRAFKKRKGAKITTPNQFIEKRKFALDSRTEVRRIQAARLIAIQRRKFFRPVKRLIGVRR